FAQAKARDMWQSPLLAPQHLVASIVAGAAVLSMSRILLIATIVHLALIVAEVATPHATAHSRLAVREMVRGRYKLFFAFGFVLPVIGIALLPWKAAAVLILIGLYSYEHAYVGAGQSVPL